MQWTQVSLSIVTVVAALVLIASAPPGGITIYVDNDNCPGPGDGSMGNPYCSIQTAIDNAVDMDEIVVSHGTYFETIDFAGKAIWLHSSDGAEVTIIDGTGFFHVVQCVSGEGSDTVLDGFTITGGNANGAFPDNTGGGMFNSHSSPTVINCTFGGNSASGGGGVFNWDSSPTVTNCTFSENSASDGGGMFNRRSNPTVINCTFAGNTASRGGGMYNSHSSPTVADCTFGGNSASDDGGGMFNWSSSPTVTNCTFSGNSVNSGGGMYNRDSSPTVTNCSFNGNSAVGGLGGGGMYNSGSSPTVTNCSFNGNSAVSGFGGGGMFNGGSSPTVTNCSFIGNSANSGGGMSNVGSSPTVTNGVLWGNIPDEIIDDKDSAAMVIFSDVQGGWVGGTGNIDADPLFVDPLNGDFRLLPGSPCIDAGNNWAIVNITDTDLDGNPRFADDPATADTGCGVPVVVDMGAYEFQGDPAQVVFADLTGDGTVGMDDLEMLLDCWSSSEEPCCVADLDLDGTVSTIDLLIMLANWG